MPHPNWPHSGILSISALEHTAQRNTETQCDCDAWMIKPIRRENYHSIMRGVDRIAAFFSRRFAARLLLMREKQET